MTILDSDKELAFIPQPDRRKPANHGPVSVRVVHPFQVAHEGQVYRPNDVVVVPLHQATAWTEHGWVEAVKPDDAKRGA